ncbi:MAG: Monomeric sarcosine oxidase [Holosporales bacterium]
MQKYDVIIIGGGIYGASIFYHLLKKRSLRVLLLEKKTVASGATLQSKGFIRCYHDSLTHCALSQQSYDFFQQFEKNNKCTFIKTGFLTIENPENEKNIQERIHFLNKKDGDISIVGSQMIKKKLGSYFFPIKKNKLYIWEKNAGYADPYKICHFFIEEGKKQGGTVFENFHVDHLCVNDHITTGIYGMNKKIHGACVVLAAGIHSDAFLKSIQEEISIEKKIIQLGYFGCSFQNPLASFLEKNAGFFGRMISKKICLLGQTKVFENHTIPSFALTDLENIAFNYFGEKSIHFIKNISGVEAYCDVNISDFSKKIENLFICTGWNGLGFKMSFKIGEIAAKKIIHNLKKGKS